jgi:predicted nuclease of restriction endonuclease-like (RecB) superfamily
MRALAETFPDARIVQQLVAQIPWGHTVKLLDRVKDSEERKWYMEQTIQHGWSRNMLVVQIENKLYQRHGHVISNFKHTLPAPQSDLAEQTIKDPYVFDFLDYSKRYSERELENRLLSHIRNFLIELGSGFSFVGQQVRIEVGGEDYYLDLLFYHLQLRCYIIVELKSGSFKPEYAGKMNFYLSAVDDLMRHVDDHPTIGLILCRAKNRIIAEYALRDLRKPIGVSEWKTKIVESLPKRLRGKLPSKEEIEKELQKK